MRQRKGFTLIEVIVCVSIIAILAALATFGMIRSKEASKLARVSSELTSIATAATQYASDNNYQYPADTTRSVPPGLEKYLAGGTWPTSIWPHGVFDWENWNTIAGQPSAQVIQMSYRLCDVNDPVSYCQDKILFPTNFTNNSAIFYCIQGPCVPHQDHPTDPGYCINCIPKQVNY